MSSQIYYRTDGSPYAAAIPLPPSPYGSPYSSPYSSPYGVHLIPLPPSPLAYNVPLPLSPTRNPLPLPPVSSTQTAVTAAAIAAGTSFAAHPLLAFNAEDPMIAWDVRLPTDTIRMAKPPFRPLTAHQLQQPAVSPPWTFVRLRSTLLPWIVECSNPAGVTVADVLDAIYDCLRRRVEKPEWRESSTDFQERLLEAWDRRCVMTGEEEGRLARLKEEKKGIRRVEWLLWDIEWLGMQRSRSELETWDIHFRSR